MTNSSQDKLRDRDSGIRLLRAGLRSICLNEYLEGLRTETVDLDSHIWQHFYRFNLLVRHE